MDYFTNIAKTYYEFFNSIMPSYLEDNVPTGTEFPYLTYQLLEGDFGIDTLQQIRIYTKSESLIELNSYVDKLQEAIGNGYILNIKNTNAKIYISKGSPYTQYIVEEDKYIKSSLINLNLKFYY